MTNWSVVSLEEILSAPPVTGVRGELVEEGGLPFVSTGLVSGGAPWLDRAPEEVTSVDPKRRTVRRDDLLLVARGIDPEKPVRCTKIAFDAEATFSESLLRLRPDPYRVDPDYLRLFFTSRVGRRALTSVATGTVITNLPQKAVGRTQVRLPPLVEQCAIVAAMAPLERGTVETARLLSTLEDLHDALREALLSGLREPGSLMLTPQGAA